MPSARSEAQRDKRDIVSGQIMAAERMIRFVPAPDGGVAPDLARKLPGRGLWVSADRAAVETAVKKNLFARAAKARLSAAPDLADQVEGLLRARLLSGLGLARRAGELTCGFEKVADAIRAGRAAWLVEASDGAADGRRKLLALARRQSRLAPVIGAFTGEELSLALGLENVIHTAFLAGRASDRWALDVQRFAGFRPLFPESWREELQSADGANIASGVESHFSNDEVGIRPAGM